MFPYCIALGYKNVTVLQMIVGFFSKQIFIPRDGMMPLTGQASYSGMF